MRRSAKLGFLVGFIIIAAAGAYRTPTYRRDVMPILEKNCVACHSPGHVAPMPFTTYEEVRPWAPQMKAVVTGKRMPPGVVQHHYGVLGDDGSLAQGEIDIIVQWVDAGAPEGTIQETLEH